MGFQQAIPGFKIRWLALVVLSCTVVPSLHSCGGKKTEIATEDVRTSSDRNAGGSSSCIDSSNGLRAFGQNWEETGSVLNAANACEANVRLACSCGSSGKQCHRCDAGAQTQACLANPLASACTVGDATGGGGNGIGGDSGGNPAAAGSWDDRLNQACTASANITDWVKDYQEECAEGNEPASMGFEGARTDRPHLRHPDINIWVRGMICNGRPTDLRFQEGPEDPDAPRIYSFLATGKSSSVKRSYSVYDWNWPAQQTVGADGYKVEYGSRGSPISGSFQDVTAAGFNTQKGADIMVPRRPRNISGNYVAMVLLATPNQITLKYTREDNVVTGYTVHIAGVCVNKKLVEKFNASAGSNERPVLAAGEVIGQALGSEVLFMVRDTGTFMNPLEENHWWDD